jgi:hypothetical protein
MVMPRSIKEILDHADELARRFEVYEPGEGMSGPWRSIWWSGQRWRVPDRSIR